jgi:hypothetical protein
LSPKNPLLNKTEQGQAGEFHRVVGYCVRFDAVCRRKVLFGDPITLAPTLQEPCGRAKPNAIEQPYMGNNLSGLSNVRSKESITSLEHARMNPRKAFRARGSPR